MKITTMTKNYQSSLIILANTRSIAKDLEDFSQSDEISPNLATLVPNVL